MDGSGLLKEFNERKGFDSSFTIGMFAKEKGMKRNTMKSKLFRAERYRVSGGHEKIQHNNIQKEEMIIEEEKNTKTITYKAPLQSARITSLKELLEYAEVDLDIWEVKDWSPNTWTVTAVINGNFETATNFQVKARLIRKIPILINPVIQPVVFNLKQIKTPRNGGKSALKPSVSLFDIHFGFSQTPSKKLVPYHDRNALAIAVDVCQYLEDKFGLKEIFLAGDVLDLAEWTTHFVVRPEFYGTTQPALIEASWFISMLKRRFPNTEIVFMEGNHEKRVEDSIIEHLGWAYQLTPGDIDKSNMEVFTINNLLGLDRMGIKYVGGYPSNDVWLSDHFKISHGSIAKNVSTATAKAILQKDHVSTIFGHIHRAEEATDIEMLRNERKVIRAVCPGCLCHVDGRIPPVDRQTRWTNGFSVVWYDKDNTIIDTVSIENNKAMYHGKMFDTKSYYDEMIGEVAL